jgi:hypothetical protein
VLKRLTTVVVRRQPARIEQCEKVLLGRRAPSGFTAEGAELLEAHVGYGAGAQGGYPCHAPLTRAAFLPPAQKPLGQHEEGQAKEKADRSNCEKS